MNAATKVVVNMRKFDWFLTHVRRHTMVLIVWISLTASNTNCVSVSVLMSDLCTPVVEVL